MAHHVIGFRCGGRSILNLPRSGRVGPAKPARVKRRIPTSVVVAYAVCVDYLVYGLILPLIPFAGTGLGKSQQIVLLAGAYAAGVFIAALILGRYGDHLGYRRTMIGAALALVLATAAVGWGSGAVMIAGRVAQGVAAGATFSAGFSLLAQRYRDRRIEAMSIAFMGSTVGSVVGPALGGWLYAAGGYQLPFLAVFGLLAIDLIALAALLPEDRSAAPGRPDLRALLLNRSIAVPLVAVALAASAWGILEPLVPYHLRQTSGASAAQIGTAMALATIAYGLAAPIVAACARRSGISLTMLFGALGMAATLPVVAASGGLVAVATMLCLGNVAYAFLLNPTSAQLADALDARALRCYATVYSISNFAYSFGMIGGSAAAYTLLARLSFFDVMLCVGVALLLGAALIAFANARR
jgi:MFS transporter, DHA1 family, solute carrier family 18 (vesicular amine transporter), member 1/2